MLEAYENPVIKDGIVVGLQGVVHDVTARMKMEEALRQSEEKFSKAFHTNPAGFALVRLSDKVIIEINESFETMMGYSRRETIGKTSADLDLWVNLQERDTMVHELIAKRNIRDKESQFRRKDGSLIIGNYSGELLSLDDEPFMLMSIIDSTKRKQAEDAVRISRDQLRTLTVKLESIREEERKHIAREIHDQLGQILTGLKMNLSWISKKISAEDALKKKTEYMLDLIDMAIQSVRKIATDLRPGVLDELGLEAAIEWQAIEFERHSGIACQLNIKKDPELAKQEFSIAVFRIFQEALTNIARHAKASLVQINLAVENNSFYLHIEDNGKGITEAELHDPKSIGILGMKERALPFGGEVTVSPKDSKGTKVSARFPLK
jgi:PAS domain S-box-containing protein